MKIIMGKMTWVKYLLCGILLCGCLLETRAQRAPDNDSIQAAISDPGSPFYYPNLFGRYLMGDMTLNLEEYRHLYYGYVWQDTFKPFETPQAKDQILGILDRNPTPTPLELALIVEYGNTVMRTEPFNPTNLNFLVYAYGRLGDTINERINYQRLNMVEQTILSSGTGLKADSPWHIISFAHAADLLVLMNKRVGKPIVVTRNVVFYPLLEREDKIRGYYFDYGRIYWFRPDVIPERKPGWEFNNQPIGKP